MSCSASARAAAARRRRPRHTESPLGAARRRAAAASVLTAHRHRTQHTGEGAKKRLETNQRRLSALRTAALLTTLLFAAVRLWARTASAGGWHVAGFVVTLLMHGFSYLAIAAAAQPTYASSGVLLDGGGDLDKGMASSYHDIL